MVIALVITFRGIQSHIVDFGESMAVVSVNIYMAWLYYSLEFLN